MNVANPKLGQELYRLSGWEMSSQVCGECGGIGCIELPGADGQRELRPCIGCHETGVIRDVGYDLNNLIRSLPHYIEVRDAYYYFHLQFGTDRWIATYGGTGWQSKILKSGTTPVDAIAKLAIELFKQGVLKPATRSNGV